MLLSLLICLFFVLTEQRVHSVGGSLPPDDAQDQRVPPGVRQVGRYRGHRQRPLREDQLPDPIPGTK